MRITIEHREKELEGILTASSVTMKPKCATGISKEGTQKRAQGDREGRELTWRLCYSRDAFDLCAAKSWTLRNGDKKIAKIKEGGKGAHQAAEGQWGCA
eukprot:2638340-Rhodomonas_salina.2